MARPTKLTPELIKKAKSYLATCKDDIIETDKGALAYVDVELPSQVGLARHLGINKDTITEWCKLEDELAKEFSVIVKDIHDEQERRLINKSLGGLYTPKIAGMMLGKHGYVEKQEVTGNDGGAIQIDISGPLSKVYGPPTTDLPTDS